MLLAIDPGADTGWALFDSCRRLTACGLIETPDRLDGKVPSAGFPIRVLIECAELRGRAEKNPNSILLMARVAGEWAGTYRKAKPEYLTPMDWKGTTSKDIDHRRTLTRLDVDEFGVLVKGCIGVSPRSASIDQAIRKGLTKSDKRGNILDAIGIGLFGVGRGVRS